MGHQAPLRGPDMAPPTPSPLPPVGRGVAAPGTAPEPTGRAIPIATRAADPTPGAVGLVGPHCEPGTSGDVEGDGGIVP
jgi:hypothetical protein